MVRFDWFLAHASADKPRVLPLYNALLGAGLRVFYDEKSLFPGDIWPKEIPKAQRDSRGSILCLSKNTDSAWYLQSEVQDAIALHRQGEHRLFPILLEPDAITPYGLNIVQAARGWELGSAGLVQQLLAATQRLPSAAPAVPAPRPAPQAVVDAWCKLMPAMRKEILLFDLPGAAQHFSEGGSLRAHAIELSTWANLQGEATVCALVSAIRREAPGLL
ncbi:MAG TPA: toll/interleukin-1 receptor domain-containing protein [Myxococcota bacterium]|nr:toll/interleukin-1 receptor domain-containing protein [Myxococcota bacterium]